MPFLKTPSPGSRSADLNSKEHHGHVTTTSPATQSDRMRRHQSPPGVFLQTNHVVQCFLFFLSILGKSAHLFSQQLGDCFYLRLGSRFRSKHGRKDLYLDHTLVSLDCTCHPLGCHVLFYEVYLVFCAVCTTSHEFVVEHPDRAQWLGEIFTGFGSHTGYTRM